MGKAVVIGAGFAGISAASCLAHRGWDVQLLEKNASPGGRARQYTTQGFTFDMGPSWYWMPDVFEQYFGRFGERPENFYRLKRLDPAYRVFFGPGEHLDIPGSLSETIDLFESLESGSGARLRKFMQEAEQKYRIGMTDFVFKPGHSVMEFARLDVMRNALKLSLFQNMKRYVESRFQHPWLRQILQFPVLFLGAKPADTPALYSLMNYADLALGTWYPEGGMFKIVEGMVTLAERLGVEFRYNQEVTNIPVSGNLAGGVAVKDGQHYSADVVVAAGDYHHIEQRVLDAQYRNYDAAYWDKRVMAPSCLIFYLGVNKKLKGLQHHNLFFDRDFNAHAREIYDQPGWPSDPLFYVCCPSQTDDTVAPEGHENLFLLMPVAPGLSDQPEQREHYYTLMMDRLEALLGETVREHVVYQRSYAMRDFQRDYYAFKGNAYGLANTLRQTAVLKPAMRNRKVSNLYFTGQLTVPGPGVPPSLISGQVAASEIHKAFQHHSDHQLQLL